MTELYRQPAEGLVRDQVPIEGIRFLLQHPQSPMVPPSVRRPEGICGRRMSARQDAVTMPENTFPVGRSADWGNSRDASLRGGRLQFFPRLTDWVDAYVRAVAFLGGGARLLVPDNAKVAVIKACLMRSLRCHL